MIKTLTAEIDNTSWPTSGVPVFPSTFHTGAKTCNLNITEMLLLIGHLTTPTVGTGVSLSELWACVRYYFALAPTADLRLTSAFADLDSHQKTILSDDFGMGVPVSWLIEPLKLSAWCDGREFATRFNALTLAPPVKLKKRGPGKSPDFVFRDENGLYHVVECKGTQSGVKARDKQLSHQTKAKQPSGAVVQKTMIKLKSHLAGQRLACGVAIAREGVTEDTHLKIRDPDGEIIIEVKEGQEHFAEDAVVRAAAARALRAAGLPWSASAMAAPSGTHSGARSIGKGKREQARLALVAERLARAETELASSVRHRQATVEKVDWVTRRSVVSLPRTLEFGKGAYRSVEVTESVPVELLRELMGGGLRDGVLAETAPWLAKEAGRLKLSSDGPYAELRLGRMFRSTMRLLNPSAE